jgi:hypothetical protein
VRREISRIRKTSGQNLGGGQCAKKKSVSQLLALGQGQTRKANTQLSSVLFFFSTGFHWLVQGQIFD